MSTVAMQWNCPGWSRCGQSYCRFCGEIQGWQVSVGGSMQKCIYKVQCKILNKLYTHDSFFWKDSIVCPYLFFRTIWKLDVPTSVTKSAPSSCSVYVIAKGKISSFRPATYADGNSKEGFKSGLPVKQLAGVKCVSVTPLFLGLYNTNLG